MEVFKVSQAAHQVRGLRRSTMKKRSFATLGVLALLAAASAFGQTTLRFDIPFEFHFLDKVMPAGQYDVNVAANNVRHLLSLECYACRSHVYSTTFGIGGGGNPLNEGRLVFNKYGETYFLSEVWTPGDLQGGGTVKVQDRK
jgi:ribosomal protein L33